MADSTNVRLDFLIFDYGSYGISKYSKTFAVNPECTKEQIKAFAEVLLSFIPNADSVEITRIDSNGLGTIYRW